MALDRDANGSMDVSQAGRAGSALMETLEPRLLLDAAGAGIELFTTARAVFVENAGQWDDPGLHYAFQGSGANIGFTDTGPVFEIFRRELAQNPAAEDEPFAHRFDLPNYTTESTQFSVTFDGANSVVPIGLDPAETMFNYHIGDQSTWRSDVAGYRTVAYPGLYDGVDLYTWGRRDSLKYEFHVAPGADWSQIRISYDGIEGLTIDETGAMRVRTALGDLIDQAPYVYQIVGGQEVEVAASFQLVDAYTYTFAITGDYDPDVELIIDPDLAWSTYLGGGGFDWGVRVAVDASGNVLVSGVTASPDWVSGGWDTEHNGGYDAFVVKLSPSGEHLWSTYLGGGNQDLAFGVAVDTSGNVLVTGETASPGWVSGGWDTEHNGGYDAFVVKLSPAGEHLWSTYLGGDDYDCSYDVAVDASGNILATGQTASSGWVSEGWNSTYAGGRDAFVVKLSPAGDHLWSTYLGGSSDESAFGIDVDAAGNVLATGLTRSPGWISGGWDDEHNGGYDGFVVKLSPAGEHLWSTYLGGDEADQANDIAVDAAGNVLVTGWTQSAGWASGGWDGEFNGGRDAFVVKLNSAGDHLWSTYLGGSTNDEGFGVAVDATGNVLVTGQTTSPDWASGGWNTSHSGSQDAFVVKLSPSGDHLWSSYLGGSNPDHGRGIAVDASDNVVVSGATASPGWVSGGWSDTHQGGVYDGFVAMLTIRQFIPGDANGDGRVDLDDFVILKNNFGATDATWDMGDFNGDGRVDLDDFVILKQNFGASAADPAPATGLGGGGDLLATTGLPDGPAAPTDPLELDRTRPRHLQVRLWARLGSAALPARTLGIPAIVPLETSAMRLPVTTPALQGFGLDQLRGRTS